MLAEVRGELSPHLLSAAGLDRPPVAASQYLGSFLEVRGVDPDDVSKPTRTVDDTIAGAHVDASI